MHELQIQEQVTAAKAISEKSIGTHIPKEKNIAPQILDQSEGDKVCGLYQIDKSNTDKGIEGFIEAISSQNVSTEVKFEVMQIAMATCPKVNMGCRRKGFPHCQTLAVRLC